MAKYGTTKVRRREKHEKQLACQTPRAAGFVKRPKKISNIHDDADDELYYFFYAPKIIFVGMFRNCKHFRHQRIDTIL